MLYSNSAGHDKQASSRNAKLRRQRKSRRATDRVSKRRLILEALEDRRLLSVSDTVVNFPGITTGSQPPDTVMDVGTNHVIQMVNSTRFQIWDKEGTSLAGPTTFGSLWSSANPQITPDAGNECQSNLGDPIVVFDHLADRWLMSQFHADAGPVAPFGMCIAISQSADPVGGVDGTPSNGDEWFLYRYDTPNFPDYPKFGVWQDAYYMSTHEGGVSGVYAFDRPKMLSGDASATMVRNSIAKPPQQEGFRNTRILPADLDGTAPPLGTPGYFVRTVGDNQDTVDPRDRIEVYAATPNFGAGTLAFPMIADLDAGDGLHPFDVMACDRNGAGIRDCIPQPDEVDTLDALSNRPMMQLKYRDFGTHQAMVFNQTVDQQDVVQAQTGFNPANEVAGIRWYELNDDGLGWIIAQQGDHAPQPAGLSAEDQIIHRWMGSAAMDEDGNIGLAYSVTNSDDDNEIFPGIRYAARRSTDPPGTLPHGEKVIVDGTAPQGNGDQSVDPQRWGDYSTTSVDPIDELTFWHTNHVAGGASRIASFALVDADPVIDANDLDNQIIVQRRALDASVVDISINGQVVRSLLLADLNSLTIQGNGGDDQLTVDSSNGLLTLPGGIHFDGGSGTDRLDLRQTGGPTRGRSDINVGASPGAGRSVIVDGADDQTVSFENLEPLTDNVPAASFSITGVPGLASLLQGANQINYQAGSLLPASGRVTVDNFEPIEFSNKSTLVIDAGAGSDLINLNHRFAPSGLTGIRVNGDDPTSASDTVVVNGTVASNTITVSSLTNDGAVITGAQPVPVTVDTTETLIINGQGPGDLGGDNLTILGSVGTDDFEHQPGPAIDQGFVGVRSSEQELLGVHYENLSDTGTVTLAGNGGADSLTALGTADSDAVAVTFTAADSIDLDLISAYGLHVDLFTSGIPSYEVQTLAGDDILDLADNGNNLSGLFGILLGGPGDSDLLRFTGTAGADDAFLVNPTFPDGQGFVFANLVTAGYSGVEHLLFQANDDPADTLFVNDPGGDDTWVVTANSDFGGDRIQLNDRETIDYDNFDDVTLTNFFGQDLFQVHPTNLVEYNDTFTVNGDGGDVLQIFGTENADAVASTATVVTTNSMDVTLGTGLSRLDIITGGGSDNVDLNGLTIETHVDAGAGDDVVDGEGVANDSVRLTLLGGPGNDNLIGGDSPTGSALGDVLVGGPGDDRLEGGRGRDQFFGNDGSDLFVWVAGDGSDLMEGGAGESDELQFIANDGDTRLELLGGGLFNDDLGGFFPAGTLQDASRALFALNYRQVVLNTSDVENIDIDALGGADQIVINNQVDPLTSFIGPVNVPAAQDNIGGTMDALNIGTDLAQTAVRGVDADLGVGGQLPTDGASDLIEVHGRLVADQLDVTTQTDVSGTSTVDVAGLDFSVRIRSSDANFDRLAVHGQSGDDRIKAAAGVENTIAITLEGDEGDDTLSADATLNGGAGNDTLIGGAGSDTLNGNAGDDTLVISAGADTFSGGSGFDVIQYQGTNAPEVMSLIQLGTTIAAGGLISGTIDVSAADIERIDLAGQDGADGITLAGLTIDSLVDAGSGHDIVDASGVSAARAEIHGGDGFDAIWGTANDDFITGGGGNDYIAALGGVDDVYGGIDNDIIVGGTGNDILFGGPDSDTLIWDPGDNNDVMEGGTGEDVLAFNGAVGTDTFTMSQLGTRLQFAREPGGVLLDVADVEDVDVNRDVSFTGTPLNESQAGGTGSAATGTANVRFDAVNSTVSIDVFVQGISAASVTGFHLHQAPTGVSGPVIVGFNSPGPFNFVSVPGGIRLVASNVPFPAANIADLMDGNTYLNLHTAAFPGGEIRGQVTAGTAAFNPGGADSITVHDLTATTVREIDLNVDHPANTGDTNDDALTDQVTLHGYTTADDVNVSVLAGGVVDVAGLAAEVRIHNATISGSPDRLTIEGNAGDDLLKAEPGVENTIGIQFNGGAGDDLLSADATLNGGAGNDTLIGGAGSDVVIGGAGDDTIDARGGANAVDGGAGTDTFLVSGTAGNDVLGVAHTPGALTITGGLSAGSSVFSSMERVVVEAGSGSDQISLTTLGGGILDYDVLGGDPIGAVGDTLALNSPTSVTFMGGPETDSGAFVDNDGAIISFDEIEALAVTLSPLAGVVVMGTGADDDITAVGTGANSIDVTVNAGPTVSYFGVNSLILQGKQGDDDFTLDVEVAGLAIAIETDGGLPTAGSDELRVTGIDGVDDEPIWVPDGEESGELTLTGLPVIVVSMIEKLIYDGQSDNEHLSVRGDGTAANANDRFEHQPGGAVDAGFVGARVGSTELLGIHYENLGDGAPGVDIDGQGGTNNQLALLGTADSDLLDIDFRASNAADFFLTTAYGDHTLVRSLAIHSYSVELLDGDDDLSLSHNNAAAAEPLVWADGSFELFGGSPDGGSDTLHIFGAPATVENVTVEPDAANPDDQDISGLGPVIDVTGYELIRYAGANADDTLTIDPGTGDNVIRVQAAHTSAWDLALSDSLPNLEFAGLDAFIADVSGQGADLVSFKTWFLQGATGGDYRFTGSGVDSLVIEGNEALADDYDVNSPAAGQLTVTDNNGSAPTITTTTGGLPGSLLVTTLGGHDLIQLDGVSLNPADVTSITVDGGAGDDTIDASANAALGKPGTTDPDVQLTLIGGDGNDSLLGAEQGGANPGDLLLGGAGDDRLEGGTGRDQFFGGGGSDLLVWVAGDGSDLMEGGAGNSDELQFIANDGSTRLALFGGGLFNDSLGGFFPAGTLQDASRAIFALNFSQVFLNTADVEIIDVDALGGRDQIIINNQVDTLTSFTGPTNVPAGQDNIGAPPMDAMNIGTDLEHTSVRGVDIDLGGTVQQPGVSDGAGDLIDVHGRLIEDNIDITTQTDINGLVTVDVAGLGYSVRIRQPEAAIDRLQVHGQAGDDNLKAAAGVENSIAITLAGDAGDDFLSADAILIGGDGDDYLVGGLLVDMIFGDDPNDATATGEDTIVASPGNDTIDGGPQFDTVLIQGSADADLIDVRQTASNLLLYDVDAPDANADLSATDTITSIEQATVDAGAGADTIRVAIADSLFNSAGASLRMNVIGGDDQASDRLGVVDADTADMSILRQAAVATAGTVEIGPANPEPFLHTFAGIEFTQVLADTLAPSGSPTNVESPAVPNRLTVFKHDQGESNNDRNNSTHLGANQTVNLDPTIDPGPGAFGFPADTDWYRVEAEVSGTIDFQVFFEQVAAVGGRPGLPGNGNLNINIFDSDGQAIAAFNTSDDNDDNERARIPAVQGEVYYFQVVGLNQAINAYDVTVINLPALVPYDLELDDELVGDPPPNNSDTGRSHHDNITRDNTPTVVLRLDDNFFLNDIPGNDTPGTPIGDAAIPIPFRPGAAQPNQPGYAIAIFDEGDTPGGPAVEEPQTPLGFATMVEAGVYQFTTPLLTDGSHFLSARVQMLDPANPLQTGFGARSLSLEIVVDTVVPPVVFGALTVADDGLHPDSDSGVQGGLGHQQTLDDNITNDETPTFWGRAEADSFIRVYVDVNSNGVVDAADFKIGQTTALPLDGNNQFPNGQWELTSTYNMNDPELLNALAAGGVIDAGEIDQRRPMLVTAEDVAGNVSPPQSLDIFVDTQGPQVSSIYITAEPGYNLWDHKDNPDGTLVPTPLIDALSIDVRDLPDRFNGFLYNALAENSAGDPAEDPGNYRLVGDYNGIIPISGVAFNPDGPTSGNPATGTIVLSFGSPLPDDRFTLTLSDNLVDPAGNKLDGESNAAEPQDPPLLPSGDGQPGGDFVARFTVDSRPELGNWAAGSVWIDTNGNFRFDPGNPDFTNRDITYTLGNGSPVQSQHLHTSDDVFAGNFVRDPNGTADGFDKLAAYGSIGLGVGGPWRWIIDTDNDGVPDINQIDALNVNGLPVAGNFDVAAQGAVQSIANGDEVAVFTGEQWFFDTDHNFQLNANAVLTTDLRGYPIVGDFDGDGFDDLGTWADDRFQFDLSGTGATPIPGLIGLDGTVDAEIQFGFIGPRERPVAADMDQDGIDDVGLWVPDRAGQTPDETAEWYFLISNDRGGAVRQAGTVNTLAHQFEPVPFGFDLYALFGDQFAIPVIGNFDPPPVAEDTDPEPVDTDPDQTNPRNPLDVNDDTVVAPGDALRVIDFLNKHGSVQFKSPGQPVDGNYYDVDSNTVVSARDALLVINHLNALARGSSEAEGEFSARPAAESGFREVVVQPLTPAGAAFQLVVSTDDVQRESALAESGRQMRQEDAETDHSSREHDLHQSLVDTAQRPTQRMAGSLDRTGHSSDLEHILDEIVDDVTWGRDDERDQIFGEG